MWFNRTPGDFPPYPFEQVLNFHGRWGDNNTSLVKVTLQLDLLQGKIGNRVGFLSGLENKANLELDKLNHDLLPQLIQLANRPLALFHIKFQYVPTRKGIYRYTF